MKVSAVKKYLRFWLVGNLFQAKGLFVNRFALILFLTGKVVRFTLFLVFLAYVVEKQGGLGQYTPTQAVFFFLTFTLIDLLGQLLFRGAYTFRQKVVDGNFDFVLTKPAGTLFQSLWLNLDFIDLITLFPFLGFIAWYASNNSLISLVGALSYLFAIFLSMVIVYSFHIFIISFGIITLEIDHLIMVYRELSNMARIPIDLYKEPFRSLLTFVFPIAIMISLPAKMALGILTPAGLFVLLVVASVTLFLSYNYWKFALKKYSSASS